MTSAHKNWSESNDTGYCLSKDRMKLSIGILTATILADRGIKLGISVP
jgi:hypothetical protein